MSVLSERSFCPFNETTFVFKRVCGIKCDCVLEKIVKKQGK